MKIITDQGTGTIIKEGRYSWGVRYWLISLPKLGRMFVTPRHVQQIIFEL